MPFGRLLKLKRVVKMPPEDPPKKIISEEQPPRSESQEKLLAKISELQQKLEDVHQKQVTADQSQQQRLMAEMNKLQHTMIELNLQNMALQKSQTRLETEIKKTQDGAFLPPNFYEPEEESIDMIQKGSLDVQAPANGLTWKVSGYSSVVPHPDFNYFRGLAFGPRVANDGINYSYTEGKVISAIVPCYNEGATDLERTIRSLYRQRLPPGWRVEVVIVMDGADHMSESMADKLYELFGIKINSRDPDLDPFVALPQAETVIVEPSTEEMAHRRAPAMEGTVGGYTLVVKRHNHRKANSQMWWLGPHGGFLKTKYSLATDCGTVFSRTATIHLIRRLDSEPCLHAVTGFQRIMSSEMQGDGSWEILHRPFDHLLRMVQRFEFEVDHVSFKSIYDSIGCMHVIPGPCGLFRYSAMGSLRDGLMYQYFRLFRHSSQGLIVGNVELVEDRIPGTLLSFPLKEAKTKVEMPPEGWPRTGFVHKALFYVEAEKPLSQLIKQRRRWLNGTFATYIWMLNEGIITRSNQDPINKFLSWFLVVLNVFQGLVVRFTGPALLVVWMFRFGLFLPDLFHDPTVIFDPEVSLIELEIEQHRLGWGLLTGGVYLGLYIAFILGHVPVAKPVTKGITITRYTEPTAYASDKQSSYRSWLFVPVLWINFVVIVLFCLNVFGIIATRGWADTPIVVQILICICFAPFLMGVLEGFMYRDFRCLFGMIYSAPWAMALMVWFTIWLPAYATTRLSDLTWGNRERVSSLDESEKALARARSGRRVGWLLIYSTVGISVAVILLMQVNEYVFPVYVLGYTLILSSTYIFSFFDMLLRIFTCSTCDNDDPLLEEFEDDENPLAGCGPKVCGQKEDAAKKVELKEMDKTSLTDCVGFYAGGCNHVNNPRRSSVADSTATAPGRSTFPSLASRLSPAFVAATSKKEDASPGSLDYRNLLDERQITMESSRGESSDDSYRQMEDSEEMEAKMVSDGIILMNPNAVKAPEGNFV